MAAADLRTELVHRVDRRVHVAPKPLLGSHQRVGDGRERHIPDDEQIDVAVAAQFPTCAGTEDKSDNDVVGKLRQRLTEDINDSSGLHEEGLQFRKDRRVAIRLEVDLTPLHGPAEQAGSRQCPKFPLHGALRGACLPHDLAEVKRLVRVPQQPTQHTTPRLAEEHGRGSSLLVGVARHRTHFTHDRTRSGYDDQVRSGDEATRMDVSRIISITYMVEAAGIEPASEKVRTEASTRLAVSSFISPSSR